MKLRGGNIDIGGARGVAMQRALYGMSQHVHSAVQEIRALCTKTYILYTARHPVLAHVIEGFCE